MLDRFKRTSGVPTFPISLAVIKKYLVVEHNEQDDTITNICNGALGLFEKLTGRAIVESEWRLTLDGFPGGGLGWWDGVRDGALTQDQRNAISINKPPLISIDEVTTVDLSSIESVFDPVNYYMDNADLDQPGRLILNFGCIWPVNLRPQNCLYIDFTAGYADGTIPGEILEALKLMVAYVWAGRGACDDTGCKACGAYAMIYPFCIVNVGVR